VRRPSESPRSRAPIRASPSAPASRGFAYATPHWALPRRHLDVAPPSRARPWSRRFGRRGTGPGQASCTLRRPHPEAPTRSPLATCRSPRPCNCPHPRPRRCRYRHHHDRCRRCSCHRASFWARPASTCRERPDGSESRPEVAPVAAMAPQKYRRRLCEPRRARRKRPTVVVMAVIVEYRRARRKRPTVVVPAVVVVVVVVVKYRRARMGWPRSERAATRATFSRRLRGTRSRPDAKTSFAERSPASRVCVFPHAPAAQGRVQASTRATPRRSETSTQAKEEAAQENGEGERARARRPQTRPPPRPASPRLAAKGQMPPRPAAKGQVPPRPVARAVAARAQACSTVGAWSSPRVDT